jgi:hypothetical protein
MAQTTQIHPRNKTIVSSMHSFLESKDYAHRESKGWGVFKKETYVVKHGGKVIGKVYFSRGYILDHLFKGFKVERTGTRIHDFDNLDTVIWGLQGIAAMTDEDLLRLRLIEANIPANPSEYPKTHKYRKLLNSALRNQAYEGAARYRDEINKSEEPLTLFR